MEHARMTVPYRRRRHAVAAVPLQGTDLVAAVWMLRLLLRGDASFPSVRHEFTDDIANVIGVPNTPYASAKTINKRLKARLLELEAADVHLPTGLLRNAGLLARMLHLTPVERDLVVLGVVMCNLAPLAELFSEVGLDPLSELSRRAACALAVDAAEVKRALRKDGTLRTADVKRFLTKWFVSAYGA
jgi:hypothetical protein